MLPLKLTDAAVQFIERQFPRGKLSDAAILLVEQGSLSKSDSDHLLASLAPEYVSKILNLIRGKRWIASNRTDLALRLRLVPRSSVPARCLVNVRGIEIAFFAELLAPSSFWTLDVKEGGVVLLDDSGKVIRPRA